jgi:uncharacterized membrane protein
MGSLLKKIFRILVGVLGAAVNIAVFGGLSWWVSTEHNVVGYIAAGLFGIMAILGAILVFILIVFDDKTPPVKKTPDGKGKSDGRLDAGSMAAAMIVANADNQDYDAGDDYSDDMQDFN